MSSPQLIASSKTRVGVPPDWCVRLHLTMFAICAATLVTAQPTDQDGRSSRSHCSPA